MIPLFMNMGPAFPMTAAPLQREPKATFLDGAIGMDDAGMFAPQDDRQYGFSPGQQAIKDLKDFARAASVVLNPPAISWLSIPKS